MKQKIERVIIVVFCLAVLFLLVKINMDIKKLEQDSIMFQELNQKQFDLIGTQFKVTNEHINFVHDKLVLVGNKVDLMSSQVMLIQAEMIKEE